MRIGVIGAGIQAKVAHLPAYSKIDGVEIIGIADVNKKSAEQLSKRYNIPHVYQGYKDLINNQNIDLISICTPHNLHKQMAIECAKAGKHILIEKPMATTVKDAEEIIHIAKDNNVKLCGVQNYRFFHSIQESKRRIDRGRIGDVISLHGYGHVFQSFGSRSIPWIFQEGSAGIIEDFGAHLIDIALYLNNFNKIKKVFALGGNFGGNLDLIVHCQIMIEFENRSLATLDLSYLSGAKEIAVFIHGTGGQLHIDVRNDHIRETHQYDTPLDEIVNSFNKLKGVSRGVIDSSYFLGAKTYYLTLIEGFINSIENNSGIPVTGEECRNTALVIECALKSIREKQQIIIGE
ncbi:MAG: Gfo/Idh/MocA family oxidoreductase [Halobacteriota archaeon]|nr:Gfo/Idh/MocA family oxidoreductase [Halobacteriota archaeon]